MKQILKKKFWILISVIISLFILSLNNSRKDFYDQIKSDALDILAIPLEYISSSWNFIINIEDNMKDLFALRAKNIELKERNNFLEYYYYLYKQVESENDILREQLNLLKNSPYQYYTAKIIASSNNNTGQQIIINRGSKNGIEKGQLVVAQNQLIGRVIKAGENASRVLMLSDPASRIPVITVDTREKFVIAGEEFNYFSCKYLNEKALLKEGELVVTDGKDVNIPSGIMVGHIVKQENNYFVKPNIDINKLEFVHIIRTKADESK